MIRINRFALKQVKEDSGLYEVDTRIVTSPDAASIIINAVLELQDEAQEVFGILTLNTKNAIAGVHVISKGSVSAALVHPREVFKAALLNNASFIVCFHNHPSGDPAPSQEDLDLTKRLMDAGSIIGIEVIDHIIIGDGKFVSLKQMGKI